MGNSLVQAGEGLRDLSTGDWRGKAANAFHDYFDGEPARWLRCGDAFHEASRALTTYADVFEWAQRQAEDAAFAWQHAEKLSEQALTEYRAQVAQAEAAAQQTGRPAPQVPFTDPGQPLREAAQAQLDRARQQLYEAGERAQSLVADARDQAPPAPTLLEETGEFLSELGQGAWASVTEMASFVGTISPTRLITDPAQYGQDMMNLARGVGAAVTHPVSFVKSAVDWETWCRNPARAAGQLVPDLALALGSAGLGAVAKGLRSGKLADEMSNEGDGRPASSAAGGRDLAMSLASQSQLTEKGIPLAGAGTNTELRAASRLAEEYGGEPSEWVKKSSTSYTRDGSSIETHWYEHGPSGSRVEFKTKLSIK